MPVIAPITVTKTNKFLLIILVLQNKEKDTIAIIYSNLKILNYLKTTLRKSMIVWLMPAIDPNNNLTFRQ